MVKENPSQVEHTCLMWTKIKHLDTYFNLTFEKIIYGDMVNKFRKEVEFMDIPIDYKNSKNLNITSKQFDF